MFKILGLIVGSKMGGFMGALLAYFIGSTIDRTIRLGIGAVNPLSANARRKVFLQTAFELMGKVAKADGHISEDEISHVEQFMTQLGMTAEHKREAIGFFKIGAQADYDSEAQLNKFMAICGHTHNLKQMLLSYLLGVAMADGVLDASEEAVLSDIALKLGFSEQEFAQLISMLRNQDHFGAGQSPSKASLNDAYAALGVSSDDSDQKIKKAYRSLMSQYHPDKLMGQGLPEDMIKGATERAQEIQVAYDLIKKSRKG